MEYYYVHMKWRCLAVLHLLPLSPTNAERHVPIQGHPSVSLAETPPRFLGELENSEIRKLKI